MLTDTRGSSVIVGLLIVALLVGALMIGISNLVFADLETVKDDHVTNQTALTGLGWTEDAQDNLPLVYAGTASIGTLLFAIFVRGGP